MFLIRIVYLPLMLPATIVVIAVCSILPMLRDVAKAIVDPFLCVKLLLDKNYKLRWHLLQLCTEKEGWWKRLFRAAGRIKI